MRKLILIFLSTVSFKSNAQTQFLPNVNSEWHYRFGNGFNGSVSNETVKYERDSILGLETVKVVRHTNFFRECNSPATRLTLFNQKNDSVFFRNSITNHQWQMLINYNAIAGQSWTFTIYNTDNTPQTYSVTVDSVNTTIINTIPHKHYNVKYQSVILPPNIWTFSSIIYERFGDNNFLFDFFQKNAPVCDADFSQGILCYQDSTFGLKIFTNYPCNYTLIAGIQEAISEHERYFIYPNPTSNKLFLEFTDAEIKDASLTIVNQLGEIVFQSDLKKELDLSTFLSGIYFLKIQNQAGQKVFKIVKE